MPQLNLAVSAGAIGGSVQAAAERVSGSEHNLPGHDKTGFADVSYEGAAAASSDPSAAHRNTAEDAKYTSS